MRVTKKYLQAELTKAQSELQERSAQGANLEKFYAHELRENKELRLRLKDAQTNLETASKLIHQSNAALFLLIEKMPRIDD